MASASEHAPPLRARASATLYRRRWLKLVLLLVPPLGWIGVAYLGALAALLVYAFWRLDPLAGEVVRTWGLDNFRLIVESDVYRTVTLRTVGTAALVTVADALLAFPLAYFMARIASPWLRALLFLGVLMPLWSSYLVRAYTWRLILADQGALNWLFDTIGLGSLNIGYSNTALFITFTYLWLPFMVLPIYAALERIPPSLVEASGDLGGRAWATFRRVILPLALPGVAAGSIFTFSLTLGDYIAPALVADTQFIGNVIFTNVGIAGNVPFAAAYATVPILVMVVYLLVVRRLGAFEAL
jgi:putative spermidine/putrescine transport system permease protein